MAGGPGGTSGARGASAARPSWLPDPRARRQRALLLLSATMSCVVLLFSGGAWALQDHLLDNIERVDVFGGLNERPDEGPRDAMTVLVAGVDRREGISREELARLNLGNDVDGNRSDTMMLVHLPENRDEVSVVSLPRDSYVEIPGHGNNKLNATYTLGGPRLAVETIENNTGVRIDHYVEVNFLGFLRVVDALGGVEICTPVPIDDPKSGLRLDAGTHMVDGATALAYVRARYGVGDGSDLDRIERQQQFMASLVQRAISTETLTNPAKLNRFINSSLASVRADEGLSRDTLRSLAQRMRGTSTDNVSFTTVPIADPGRPVPGIGSVAIWDPQRSSELFDQIRRDQPLVEPSDARSRGAGGGTQNKTPDLTVPPERIATRVLNGGGVAGLATKAARDLRGAGFTVTSVGNAPAGVGGGKTVIRHGPNRADSAKTLRAAIPGATLLKANELGQSIEVVVGSSWPGTEDVTVEQQGGGSGAANGDGTGTERDGPDARTATQNLCR